MPYGFRVVESVPRDLSEVVPYGLRVRAARSELAARVTSKIQGFVRRRRGQPVTVEDYMARYAAGRSVVDVGGMWGIDGEHSFAAARAGATRVVCVDLYKTPEFDKKLGGDANGKVEWLFGDASSMATADAVGEVDLVWCFGLFYHHPSPYLILKVLREMCRERLILETLGIPDVPGVANMALWVPMQTDRQRELWRSSRGAATRFGITTDFDPNRGFQNNFWAPSPSAMRAMLETAGFEVEEWSQWGRGGFRFVYVATPTRTPLQEY